MPASPYRSLIDATERDVRLVTVGGDPIAGDASLLTVLKPGDHETVTSGAAGYVKAVDLTNPSVPEGTQTLAQVRAELTGGLAAFGGDNPPGGGGPSPLNNTWSTLKSQVDGGSWSGALDDQFRDGYLVPLMGTASGGVNIEAIEPGPLLSHDDDWFFDVVSGRVTASGFVDDPTPPFGRYAANTNTDAFAPNPFTPLAFEQRWWFNVAPACSSLTLATPEDSAVQGTLSCVDSGPPHIAVAGPPTHGAVTLLGGLSFLYAPEADYFGADAFTLVPTDGELDGATVTVVVDVIAVEDPPASTTTTTQDASTTTEAPTVPAPAPVQLAASAPTSSAGQIGTLPATGSSTALPLGLVAVALLVAGGAVLAFARQTRGQG
jgi:hypothetical protein